MSLIKASFEFTEENKKAIQVIMDQGIPITKNDTSKLGQLIECKIDTESLCLLKPLFTFDNLSHIRLCIGDNNIFFARLSNGEIIIDGLTRNSKNFTYYVTCPQNISSELLDLGDNIKACKKSKESDPFTWKVLSHKIIPLNEFIALSKKYPNVNLTVKIFSNTYTLSPSINMKLTILNGNMDCEYINNRDLPLTGIEKIFTGAVFLGMFTVAFIVMYGAVRGILSLI